MEHVSNPGQWDPPMQDMASGARSQHKAHSREPGRWRHPQLPPVGPGSPFTRSRMPVVGEVTVAQLAPSPCSQRKGWMLLLWSCCLRLEGIHYLPGYRQLSEAIFQLCAFKELIGGEIILSRRSQRRHNFIRLPQGLPGPRGGLGSLGSAPVPTPTQGCKPGDTALARLVPVWGSYWWHRGCPPTAPHWI